MQILSYTDIEQRYPILEGLQRKAAEHQGDAEYAEAALGEIVGIVFDVGVHDRADGGGEAGDHAHLDREPPDVIDLPDQGAAQERGRYVADGPGDGSPKLAAREARTSPGEDLLEVIAFDSSPTKVVKMQPAKYRARIQNDIARIAAGGGTEIQSALDAGYQTLTVTRVAAAGLVAIPIAHLCCG